MGTINATWTAAAKSGHSSAQFALGVLCENGRGLSRSDNDAVRLFYETRP